MQGNNEACNDPHIGNERKFVLVDTIFHCVKIVEDILLKEAIIAIDCEGVFLSKEGRLTLMQISLRDERVFIFDILKGGSLMFLGLDDKKRGLKSVLENKKILKLIHDCRNDWDSLLHQYSVRIYNFIDTQEAYFVFKLFYFQEITLPISLLKFIENLTQKKLQYKEKIKSLMNQDPYLWTNRPLSENQLAYACEDVSFLIKAWTNLKGKFNDNMIEIIYFLTILKVVDYQMFLQFGEYLQANIIYYSKLMNVFSNKEFCHYMFAYDYIYGFFLLKNSSDIEKIRKENVKSNITANSDEKTTNSETTEDSISSLYIIKQGFNYKRKQKFQSFLKFQEELVKLRDQRFATKNQLLVNGQINQEKENQLKPFLGNPPNSNKFCYINSINPPTNIIRKHFSLNQCHTKSNVDATCSFDLNTSTSSLCQSEYAGLQSACKKTNIRKCKNKNRAYSKHQSMINQSSPSIV